MPCGSVSGVRGHHREGHLSRLGTGTEPRRERRGASGSTEDSRRFPRPAIRPARVRARALCCKVALRGTQERIVCGIALHYGSSGALKHLLHRDLGAQVYNGEVHGPL